MLSKLMKYDLRGNVKLFLFIWPAMLVVAGLQRLLLEMDIQGGLGKFLVGMLTTVMVLTMFAVVVLCFVICVIRFYSGLLRREGYLMFTLPVKPWQLITSKLLSAMLTLIPTCLFAYFGIALILSGTTDGVWEMMFNFDDYFSFDAAPNAWTLLLLALTGLVTLANIILRVYFVSCLGHLFRRARIFLSILFYYLIGVVMQIVAMICLVSVGTTDIPLLNAWDQWMSTLSLNGALCALLGLVLLASIAVGCLYFFVSEAILRKRLNLD